MPPVLGADGVVDAGLRYPQPQFSLVARDIAALGLEIGAILESIVENLFHRLNAGIAAQLVFHVERRLSLGSAKQDA